MELDQIMETYGFKTSSSCSGFEWYVKGIVYEGNDAFVTITADDELHLPESINEPVVVSITDQDSGNELKPPQRFESMQSYLDTLNTPS
ncbi:MAG: hypothetical protein P8012_07780 [Desulfobacterales bacterium]